MKTLPRVRAGEIGLRAADARGFLRRAGELGLHSFILARDGKVGAEAFWKPYAPAYPHMLHSLSKSFTSTAFGFAVQEGLAHLDDRVADFFPEYLPAGPCENMRKMTVRDLLTMHTGHLTAPNVIANCDHPDWIRDFLESYVPETPGPDCHYVYNTAATYMVSAIVQKVTGQTVVDYLKPRLFDPLGFGEYWWDPCPKGISAGGFGFNVTTEDIAKFGVFLADRGAFGGKQLLDPAWVDMATSKQVNNDPNATPDWRVGYGFQFWMCNHPGTFRGDGANGQLCVVCRPKNLVFACTAQLNTSFQDLMDAIYEYLVDPLSDEPLPESAEEAEFLREAAELTCQLPEGEAAPAGKGGTWEFAPNPFGLKTLTLAFGETDRLTAETENGSFTLPVGHGRFLEGTTSMAPRANVKSPFWHEAACAGAWKDGRYRLSVIYTRATTRDDAEFEFLPHGVRVTVKRVGSFFGGEKKLAGFLREGGER